MAKHVETMNKNKKELMYILLSGVWLLGIFACSTSELRNGPEDDEDPFKDGQVPVEIPIITKAVNDGDPENIITDARLIVIKNSKITNNTPFTLSTVVYTDDEVHVSDFIPVGNIELFLIVNEIPGWGLASLTVGQTYFPDDLEHKILSFTSLPVVDPTHPIPMYRQYRNLHVTLDGELSVNGATVTDLGEVDRLYAKVTLVIGSVFATLDNGGDPIQLDSISIKSIPKYSYLGPSWWYQESTDQDYFDGPRTHRTTDYVADNNHFLDSIIYYVPEHRVFYPQFLTYLSVKASLYGNTDVDEQVEFKIAVGDGLTATNNDLMLSGLLPLNNLFVTRNTHYHIEANIKSFDLSAGQTITIKPTVVGWENVSLTGPSFNEYTLQVSQDLFTFPSSTTIGQYVVRVETDHPDGWSATVAKASGYAGNHTALIGSYTAVSASGDLKFDAYGLVSSDGTAPSADTIKVTAGKITKHILIKNE
jgi:hypothetical protein